MGERLKGGHNGRRRNTGIIGPLVPFGIAGYVLLLLLLMLLSAALVEELFEEIHLRCC